MAAIRFRVAIAPLLMAVGAATAAVAQQSSLHYTMRIPTPYKPLVEVAIHLQGLRPERQSVTLSMPEGFAFAQLPAPLIEGPIDARAADRPLTVVSETPFRWRVETLAAPDIVLRYVVALTHRAAPEVKNRDEYEYPYLAADHGMLVTAALLMTPEDVPFSTATVHVEPPAGWPIIAPWAPSDAGPGIFHVHDRASLSNDLLAIGAWRRQEAQIGDFLATVALAPGQDALAEAVEAPIRKIVEHELALFGVPAKGKYLFLFGRPEGQGLGGSPKTRSMTLYVEPRLAAHAGEHLAHLIAHEFFHTWNAQRAPLGGELRWVGEGFTDYYAFLVSARVGLLPPDAFAAKIAEKMQALSANPLRGKTALSAAGGTLFFTNRDAYNLTYDGGLLVAAWLDCALRKQSGASLDQLLREYINDDRWKSGASPDLASFLAKIADYGGSAIRDRVEQLVTTPYDLDPIKLFGEIGVVVTRESNPADLRIRANFDGPRVKDIDPRDAAARLGVRPGDLFSNVNGRDVATPQDVVSAWATPQGGRIRATLQRDGAMVQIDQPIPSESRFAAPVEAWKAALQEKPLIKPAFAETAP